MTVSSNTDTGYDINDEAKRKALQGKPRAPENAPKRDTSQGDAPDSGEPGNEPIKFKAGGRSYQFGEYCYYEYEKGSGEDAEIATENFARNLWPLEVYRRKGGEGGVGVRFQYISRDGRESTGTVSAEHFVSKADNRRGARKLSEEGVHVLANQGAETIEALAQWADCTNPERCTLVDSPGWHGGTYVNGETIYGEGQWYADAQDSKIRNRSQRSGTLKNWRALLRDEVQTHALRASVGVSLAGSLIGMLNEPPFVVHLYGASSIGKSTAGELAAAVWSNIAGNGVHRSWDTTTNAIEGLAEIANGACLVMDEMHRWQKGKRKLSTYVHKLASKQGRNRSKRFGGVRDTASYAMSAISTGERSIASECGTHLQGGQMVRMFDLHVKRGEVTTDGANADNIKRGITGIAGRGGVYGVAGDAWTEYLAKRADKDELGQSVTEWQERLSELDDNSSPETGRVLKGIALIGAALDHAAKDSVGVVPWSGDDIREAVWWFAKRIVEGRAPLKGPKERALKQFYDLVESQPKHFPSTSQPDTNARRYGFVQRGRGEGEPGTIITSEGMLEQSDILRDVSPRSWLKWAVEQGYAEDMGRTSITSENIRRRWKAFKNEPPESVR